MGLENIIYYFRKLFFQTIEKRKRKEESNKSNIQRRDKKRKKTLENIQAMYFGNITDYHLCYRLYGMRGN